MTLMVFCSVLWLGIMTAVSPCPLASNIAAISFIGRHVGSRRRVLVSGLLYTLGRTLIYVGLGVALTLGLLASGQVSRFCQRYLNEILGPVLILLGMILLGMIGSGTSLNLAGDKLQQHVAGRGVLSALPLGMLFALSFCPISAGLFFGVLIPLSVKHESRLVLPVLYGIGTALPVIVFGFVIAYGAEHLSKAFARLTQLERTVRNLTAAIFIGAGVYYCLVYVYELPLIP